MGLAEQGSPAERPYVLVRAAEAATRDLRNGRGRSLRLLEPDMAGGASSVSRVVIDPGTQPGPFHLHERANNIYIGLDGVTQIRVAQETVDLGPLDLVFIPSGVPHSTHNAGGQPVSLLAMYDRSVADDFVVVNEGIA
jgi:mannose-6-phosphate isomerase-like protein (cupin superfamily)